MNKRIVWLTLLLLAVTSCAAPQTQQPAVAVSAAPTVEPAATESAPAPATATAIPDPTATALPDPTATAQPVDFAEIAAYEMRGSFDFFWQQANTDAGSPGYGLVRDRYPGSEGIASMASLGFGLTAVAIGVEKGYITYDEGYARVNGTLDTLLAMDRVEGFYYHFVDMKTGKRAWNSEVSSIDTSILLMGVLSAGEYFGGEIETKARQIFDGVNWPWFVDPARNMFYMAYRPEKGFEGHWDFYAEQLMMYVLAAGSSTYPVDDAVYYAFTRHSASYGGGQPFIHSWFGSIFTYQFSHAWIDFRGYTDREGVNWYQNSLDASLAHYNYAVKMEPKYETLGANAWGLTASDGPNGYEGRYGAPPSGYDNKSHFVDDTIPPAGAIGSIIFLPAEAQQAMRNYYSLPALNGPYGFKDAYNLSEDWYASDVIGIDKGISLLMLANFENDAVYRIMMENDIILQGLANLQLTKIE